MNIYKRYDGIREKELLIVDGKIVGEYVDNLFIRSFRDCIIREEEEHLSISENVLLFNRSIGSEDMFFYFKTYTIYSTIDEFMAFGDWVNYRNGDFVIHCPLKYLRVYDNPTFSRHERI